MGVGWGNNCGLPPGWAPRSFWSTGAPELPKSPPGAGALHRDTLRSRTSVHACALQPRAAASPASLSLRLPLDPAALRSVVPGAAFGGHVSFSLRVEVKLLGSMSPLRPANPHPLPRAGRGVLRPNPCSSNSTGKIRSGAGCEQTRLSCPRVLNASWAPAMSPFLLLLQLWIWTPEQSRCLGPPVDLPGL